MNDDDRIRHVLNANADELTQLPNVVGVGIGAADDNDPNRVPVVAVYVSHKVPPAQLAPEAAVPKQLEATVDGIRVRASTRVIEVGDIKPDSLH